MMTRIEQEHYEAVIRAAREQVSWRKVRRDAAIAVLPQCVALVNGRIARIEGDSANQIASMAVQYADALVRKLKEGER